MESLLTPLKAVLALAVGWALSRLISTPMQLAAIAVLAAVADTVSVIAGPTRTAVDDAPDAFADVALHLPPWDGIVLVGPVDVVFAAVFVAGAHRVGLRTGPVAVAVLTGLVVATGIALGTGAAVPAIPFMAAGLLAASAGRLRPARA